MPTSNKYIVGAALKILFLTVTFPAWAHYPESSPWLINPISALQLLNYF